MGIKDLSKVIGDNAPRAIKQSKSVSTYLGRKVAIDASMALYQFLISIRQDGGNNLTDDTGETTSHIIGTFYRTVKLIVNNIKPVYVFDGKPPLAKRHARAREATAALEAAKESGAQDEVVKMAKRTVRLDRAQTADVRRLLLLMGVPIVDAPCEAEAQCAVMAKAGIVWATSTEDMDALTFGTPILLRHLNFSDSKKDPILELHLDTVLKDMGLNMDQFVDLCILLGCDYCDTIKGIGKKKAVEFLHKYGSIEGIIQNINTKKFQVPDFFPYQEVRELFKHPLVQDPHTLDLKWTDPDEEGLINFLVGEKGFSKERIVVAIEKLKKARAQFVQERLDGFFKFLPPPPTESTTSSCTSTSSTKATPSTTRTATSTAKKPTSPTKKPGTTKPKNKAVATSAPKTPASSAPFFLVAPSPCKPSSTASASASTSSSCFTMARVGHNTQDTDSTPTTTTTPSSVDNNPPSPQLINPDVKIPSPDLPKAPLTTTEPDSPILKTDLPDSATTQQQQQQQPPSPKSSTPTKKHKDTTTQPKKSPQTPHSTDSTDTPAPTDTSISQSNPTSAAAATTTTTTTTTSSTSTASCSASPTQKQGGNDHDRDDDDEDALAGQKRSFFDISREASRRVFGTNQNPVPPPPKRSRAWQKKKS
ncbi:flap endonuclease 1 [Pelomyxa schiedti]|nr:flap endonuclease 1 [Pelomyxa schiedti]